MDYNKYRHANCLFFEIGLKLYKLYIDQKCREALILQISLLNPKKDHANYYRQILL